MSAIVLLQICQIILFTVKSVHGVPAPYCNYNLNNSDCGGTPTPVFSYYKPGSRCEIEIWRGCPTFNRFDNEATCSHFCIGKLGFGNDSDENRVEDETSESCDAPLDTSDCGKKPISVFTYDQKDHTCKRVEWKGCMTSNKFPTEEQCKQKCLIIDISEFEKKINKLSPKEVDEVNNLIDDMISDDHHQHDVPTKDHEPTEEPAVEHTTGEPDAKHEEGHVEEHTEPHDENAGSKEAMMDQLPDNIDEVEHAKL